MLIRRPCLEVVSLIDLGASFPLIILFCLVVLRDVLRDACNSNNTIVFYNSDRVENPQIMATDAGWLRDFDAVRRSTGQDEHSVYANPQFRNAPVAFAVLDSRRLTDCTRSKLFLRGGTTAFRKGDHVEVSFDGLARRVTGVDAESILIDPPLDAVPTKGWQVANWGDTA